MSENVTPLAAKRDKRERENIDAVFEYVRQMHARGEVVAIAFTVVTKTGAAHNASASLTGHFHRLHSGVHRHAVKIALQDD